MHEGARGRAPGQLAEDDAADDQRIEHGEGRDLGRGGEAGAETDEDDENEAERDEGAAEKGGERRAGAQIAPGEDRTGAEGNADGDQRRPRQGGRVETDD